MALIRDPNWTGPGPGPFIDDGMGGTVTPALVAKPLPGYGGPGPGSGTGGGGTDDSATQGRGQFTSEQAAAIDAAAYSAAGYSGDAATADYIRQLQAGALGGGADTQAALNRLIEQGKARNVATFGVETGDDGLGGGATTTPVPPVNPVPPVDPVPGGTRVDAKKTIEAVLAKYGLGASLAKKLYDLYATGTVNIDDPDALIFAIRDEEEYKTRFPANAIRSNINRKGGPLAELDPASYLALENDYRRLLQSNGLPTGFYDQTEDFTALLSGDVSPQELQDRVQNGFRAVQDADPQVLEALRKFYPEIGNDETSLAAYFLDPERAAPILTRRVQGAKIAARAKEQGNLMLEAATAEEIAARGITAQEAEAGFTAMGLQEGLYTEMFGEQALTQQQKVGAALGYDVAGQQGLKKRQSTRKAEFGGGGSFAKTTGATTGITQTGLGVAD